MSVGAFPGVTDFKRRTVRAMQNPLDKCTVISIFPKEIDETKHTIQPGRFVIPAGEYEKPSFLVVGSSSWWKEVDEESPLLEIPNSSIQVADSIVKDYCLGMIGCNQADSMPGLFYLPGTINHDILLKQHKNILDKARDNQNRWYSTLVIMADGLWSQSNGNPLAISDLMRLAARSIGQNTKEWLQDFQATETVRCVACGALRNPLYPMCGNCKTVIDPKKYAEMGLVQGK